jgi:uncharacterized protein YbgA (DUF1722 family)/uncharacterized protein YbbK (DUF523 family)
MKERAPTQSKPRLGVSTCLLGERVRYDGGHKRDRFITDELGRYVEFVPICPEVEVGLPTPRPPLRLVGKADSPRLVFAESNEDITDRMEAWARRRCEELEKEDLCGYIFKSKSPSSGMARVKVYDRNGVPSAVGVGVFARAFMEHFPLLPVEDDGRLHDVALRENFLERVFALKRWQELTARGRKRGDLIEFHARHKLLLMSHSPKHLTELGRLVAEARKHPPTQLYERYFAGFMHALGLMATVPKQCNVLQHVMGFFKRHLTADEKQELLDVIEQYRGRTVPLIVPITLLNHYVRKYRSALGDSGAYLAGQHYLHPHPAELSLRSHI